MKTITLKNMLNERSQIQKPTYHTLLFPSIGNSRKDKTVVTKQISDNLVREGDQLEIGIRKLLMVVICYIFLLCWIQDYIQLPILYNYTLKMCEKKVRFRFYYDTHFNIIKTKFLDSVGRLLNLEKIGISK